MKPEDMQTVALIALGVFAAAYVVNRAAANRGYPNLDQLVP